MLPAMEVSVVKAPFSASSKKMSTIATEIAVVRTKSTLRTAS